MKRRIKILITKYKHNLEVVKKSMYNRQYTVNGYTALSNTIIDDLEQLLKASDMFIPKH